MTTTTTFACPFCRAPVRRLDKRSMFDPKRMQHRKPVCAEFAKETALMIKALREIMDEIGQEVGTQLGDLAPTATRQEIEAALWLVIGRRTRPSEPK